VAGSVSLVPALEPRKLQDLHGGPNATVRARFLFAPRPVLQLGFSGKKKPENTNFNRPRPPVLSMSVSSCNNALPAVVASPRFLHDKSLRVGRSCAGNNRLCCSSHAFA